MAAAAQPPTGLFTFFKHGALLPERNRGLFLSILVLTAALPLVSPRLELLRVQWRIRRGGARRLEPRFLSPHPCYTSIVHRMLVDPRFEAAVALVDDNANVHVELGPHPLTVTFVYPVIKIITVYAAVASYTGERHTLVSILGKVQSNLWGTLVTLSFGFVLECAAQLPLIFLAYGFPFIRPRGAHALDALLELVSLPVRAIRDVAVIASVAEPGQCGPRAAARAWRLMEGKKAQAALYAAAVWTLSLLYKLARWWWPRSVASELPAVATFVLLRCADEVFFVAVVTAYYFECRRSQRQN